MSAIIATATVPAHLRLSDADTTRLPAPTNNTPPLHPCPQTVGWCQGHKATELADYAAGNVLLHRRTIGTVTFTGDFTSTVSVQVQRHGNGPAIGYVQAEGDGGAELGSDALAALAGVLGEARDLVFLDDVQRGLDAGTGAAA